MNAKLEKLEKDLLMKNSQIAKENQARNEVREGKEYQDLAALAMEVADAQKALLDVVPDSSREILEMKSEVIEIFIKDNLKEYGSLSAKIKKENYVNANRVLSAFDGDVDLFVALADFKQTKLKAMIKDLRATKKPEDAQLARELTASIQSKGEKITDIIIG